jgi:hypothetical protein
VHVRAERDRRLLELLLARELFEIELQLFGRLVALVEIDRERLEDDALELCRAVGAQLCRRLRLRVDDLLDRRSL